MAEVSNRAAEMVSALEKAPWGDLEPAIEDVEFTMACLIDATGPHADEWDDHELELPWADEFSVPLDEVKDMSSEMRLRYVGRLIRSLALFYGDGRETGSLMRPADVLHLVAKAQR